MIRISLMLILLGVVTAGCAGTGPADRALAALQQEGTLEAMIDQRLTSDPVTSRLRLGISSSDGIVTVTGRIDSAEVRLRMLSIVRGTPGVRAVIDKTFQF